ncbi:hypothetical protein [Mesorhizobium sp. f-mel]
MVETLDEKGGGSLMDLARDQEPDFLDATRGPGELAAHGGSGRAARRAGKWLAGYFSYEWGYLLWLRIVPRPNRP